MLRGGKTTHTVLYLTYAIFTAWKATDASSYVDVYGFSKMIFIILQTIKNIIHC